MARCVNLDCDSRDVVKATTDIAGPGVLYAYLVSAILAILSIVYGYLSDSLPESYLNATDRRVIDSFQSCMPSESTTVRIRAVYDKIKSIVLLGYQSRPHRKLTRRQREEVVKRFILTLSDQQLATGLAILIAAVANQCTLTVWEFQLAFALAWFSSTTHLATLDCLQEYFLDHGAVRNWRVFGMIALLILLMYSLIMSMASVDNTIPIQCTFSFFGQQGYNKSTPLELSNILSVGLTLVLLLWQYLVRIHRSYKKDPFQATFFERVMFKIRTRSHRSTFNPNKVELAYMIEEAVRERYSYRRRRRLEHIRNSRGLRRHWLIAYRASETYSESFLSLGPMLIFMIAFGFTQLYVGRWHSRTPLEIDTSMGVGQITPLVLLILPVLVAAESYYEVQDLDEVAEAKAITIDKADAAAAHHRHYSSNSSSSSGMFPLRAEFQRAYGSIELRDLEPLDLSHAADQYEDLVHDLEDFFYLETKMIRGKTAALSSRILSEEDDKRVLLGLKAHVVSSHHVLAAQENALEVTTLMSLIEFACCSLVSAALGILVYIEGSRTWTTVASFILFGLSLTYKLFDYAAYLRGTWFDIDKNDYKRLMTEAKTSQFNTEYCGHTNE